MNESTFEAHLASSLSKIFPTPLGKQIKTQAVFTLKLGHTTLTVDGAASYLKGRADIILSIEGKATILLELSAQVWTSRRTTLLRDSATHVSMPP
jgi:hypothetical protein